MENEEEKGRLTDTAADTDDVLSRADEKQRKIRDALKALDPENPERSQRLAGLYEGLVLTSKYRENPDRVAQVAHSARELTSILPRYFKGIPIAEEPTEDANPQQENQRSILASLVDKHPEKSALPAYLKKKFADDLFQVNRELINCSKHRYLKQTDEVDIDEQEFDALVWKYEDLLHQLLVERPFFEDIQAIDRLLEIQSPTPDDIAALAAHINQPQHRRYFFEKCQSPEWLLPLASIGAFKDPQEPIREESYVRFVGWPESQYLSRMAREKPQEVFDIIKELTSENPSVLDDFVDAAINSLADIAVQYVNIIVKKKWLKATYNLQLPDKVGALMQYLAREGSTGDALRLARELFDTRIDPRTVSEEEDANPIIRSFKEAKPYFDEWRLGEIAQNQMSELAQANPVGLFEMYAACFRQALRLEDREKDDFYDYSHIWRPNLMKARNRREDAKNIMLDGIIDLMEANRENVAPLKNFGEALRKHPGGVFRRLEIHLYLLNPEPFPEEIEELLSKPEAMHAYNLRREYLPLLEKEFPSLSAEAQKKIIANINQGPEFTKPEDMSDENFVRMQQIWKARYLSRIENYIPNDEQREYRGIIEREGVPEDDDGEMVTWEGGKTPIEKEKFEKMRPAEAIDYLAAYQPPDDPFDRFSTGGLGMMFASVVTDNPLAYGNLAWQFITKKIRPIFLYHFFNGLKEGLRQGKGINWEPVLRLAHKVVVDFRKDDFPKPANRDEQDWDSVHRAVADFMGDALRQGELEIPISYQKEIWEILSVLAQHPEPTPDYESRDGNGGLDPVTLSINTVRGEAMHAVINYGLWVARHLPEEEKKKSVKIPDEVTALLTEHANPAVDASLAVRSVYGWRLPNISYLNWEWLEAHKETIFPSDSKDYLFAAWEGYLSNPVYKEIFRLLKKQYYEFIPYLGTFDRTGYRAGDVDQRFPQHVMLVYVHQPEDEDFVEYFFEKAIPKARAEAINFAGRVILREVAALENAEEIRGRLRALWDSRLALPSDKVDPVEFQEFGWWFKESPFGKRETLERMIKTMQLMGGKKIDVEHEIVEELVAYASDFPLESITLVDLLARSEKEIHGHLYRKEAYQEVIRIVKKTENLAAQKKADELVNFFGSVGLIDDFRHLL